MVNDWILYCIILSKTAPKGITVQVTPDICTTLIKPNFQIAAQKLHTGHSLHLTLQPGISERNSIMILCYFIWSIKYLGLLLSSCFLGFFFFFDTLKKDKSKRGTHIKQFYCLCPHWVTRRFSTCFQLYYYYYFK